MDSTLSAEAPAFVPTATKSSGNKHVPSRIEANVAKLISSGLSDTGINARLASTAARHGIAPYQFTPDQLAVYRQKVASKEPVTSSERPVKPIPKSSSARSGAKAYLPETASVPKTNAEKDSTRRLIVILSKACLEVYRSNRPSSSAVANTTHRDVLLNCDDHQGFLAKENRDIADARPDITHQCLLTLLDSPLNKAGLLQVYVQTAKGVLIEINPSVRIPRTFKRFSGLMGEYMIRS